MVAITADSSSLLCPIVQAAPALSVCGIFGLLSAGSWGVLRAASCSAWSPGGFLGKSLQGMAESRDGNPDVCTF